MDFVNETKVAAAWTMGFGRDGREIIVVAVKATFAIPSSGETVQLADEQSELIPADVFTGQPGHSAPLLETDYAHHKPFCDVLVNGTAYAPWGQPTRRTEVGIKVGTMVKSFAVVGERQWLDESGGSITRPGPFETMPISYDNAFGGVEKSKSDSTQVMTYLENPVGRGYSHYKEGLAGMPLPNTEESDRTIENPSGNYRPMAFGSIGRSWQPRVRFAGTYDQQWLESQAPFWPDDFDYRYFQSAPPDQQIAYPTGGETVMLKNLTPNGHVGFRLPTLSMPILFIPHRGREHEVQACMDTLLIEPDLGRFALTWRACYPLRKSCFDLLRVVAGKSAKDWHGRQRFGDKPYYRNLAELIRARRR